MRPLLLMRKKGMFGPMFGRHACSQRLIKSVGNFIGISDGTFHAVQGWTGLPGCLEWGAFAGWTGDQNCGEDTPVRENLYSNWELVGGSDIVQDVPQAGLPDLHTLVFNTTFPCDATYTEVRPGELSYDFNSAQDEVRLLLQQTIGADGRFEVGKIYRYQAKVRTVTDSPTGSDVRALHIATTVDLTLLDTDNSFIAENSGYTVRWIDFEVTAENGRGNFRHGAGVFDPVYTEQQTTDLAIYEIGGQVPTVGTLDFPDAIEGQSYNYDLLTIISNATSYGYSGTLPADISFDSGTGVFSSDEITSASTSQTITVYGVNEYGQSEDSNSDELSVIPAAGDDCVLEFDGTNYATLNTPFSLPENFTLSVDLYIDPTYDQNNAVLASASSAVNAFILHINQDTGTVQTFYYDDTGTLSPVLTATGLSIPDTDHNVTITKTGSTATLLLNDQVADTAVWAYVPTVQIDQVGKRGAAVSYMHGNIYHVALTDTDNAANNQAWTLNSGSITTEPSDTNPGNTSYNLTYHGIEAIDWSGPDCP